MLNKAAATEIAIANDRKGERRCGKARRQGRSELAETPPCCNVAARDLTANEDELTEHAGAGRLAEK